VPVEHVVSVTHNMIDVIVGYVTLTHPPENIGREDQVSRHTRLSSDVDDTARHGDVRME
jgi:hypothetical protein